MRSAKGFAAAHIPTVTVSAHFGPGLYVPAIVERAEVIHLGRHVLRRFDVSVVINPSTGRSRSQTFAIFAKAACIAITSRTASAPDDARLSAIGQGIAIVIVGAKVVITKRQAIDARSIDVLSHRSIDAIQVVLVQYFVSLQIETPIALASVERQVGLLRDNQSTATNSGIPDSVDYFEFLGIDGLQRFDGTVVAITYRQYKFINQWQQRLQTFNEWIVVANRIANNGETRNLHLD